MKAKTLDKAKPYLFLLPCLLIFAIFVYYPFVKTILYSFTLTSARGIPVAFAGLDNYIALFQSERFLSSLLLTLQFAPMVAIPTLLISFTLAVIATNKSRGHRFYEVAYAIPMAIASAPAAAIWVMLLAPNQSGYINYLLGTDISWLYDQRYALLAVTFVTVWMNIGTSFIFMLTGLKNVPEELLESARMDGAGYFRRLFHITVPIASPQIFFVVFFNITSSFQAFAQIRLLTEGGPSYSTNVLVYSIYQSALRDGRFERAFAQSVVLFFIILVITLIQFKFEDRTVQYG